MSAPTPTPDDETLAIARGLELLCELWQRLDRRVRLLEKRMAEQAALMAALQRLNAQADALMAILEQQKEPP